VPDVALHSARDVLSRSHLPTWLMLAAAAGSVNAGALLACSRFVSHVTGTVTQIGVDFGASLVLAFDYTLVLLAFIAGAMASVIPIQGRFHRGKAPLHAAPLVVVALVVLATGVLGHFGVFGPIGGEIEEAADFWLLCVLAFAMGLLNATVASSTGGAVRTTHMTGPATDLGVQFATAWYLRGDDRRFALASAGLRATKIAGFAAGAALMLPLMSSFGHLAFVAPAGLVMVSIALSFLPHRSAATRRLASVTG
jgi:uncharacterized membrane protein YoaK (UPF0700 family)